MFIWPMSSFPTVAFLKDIWVITRSGGQEAKSLSCSTPYVLWMHNHPSLPILTITIRMHSFTLKNGTQNSSISKICCASWKWWEGKINRCLPLLWLLNRQRTALVVTIIIPYNIYYAVNLLVCSITSELLLISNGLFSNQLSQVFCIIFVAVSFDFLIK